LVGHLLDVQRVVGSSPARPTELSLFAKREPSLREKGVIDWDGFRGWVKSRYAKSYAPSVRSYALEFRGLLTGDLTELEAFSRTKRGMILRALTALSKYLGVYEQFKQRMKQYGLKWESQDSFESFLRIMDNKTPDVLGWFKQCMEVLDESYKTFLQFALISGMRRSEVVNSFNLIITLGKQGRLNEYYNVELQSLEHFRYKETFIRGKKNVFFSLVPKEFIDKIIQCNKVSVSSFKRRRMKHGLSAQFHGVRDFYATFMRKHGLLQEEVDIIQGRIGKSMFMKHYFSPEINDLKQRTLSAVVELRQKTLS
jgi:intergrase/recombinase